MFYELLRKRSLSKHPKRDWKILARRYQVAKAIDEASQKGLKVSFNNVCDGLCEERKHPKRDWKYSVILSAFVELVWWSIPKGIERLNIHIGLVSFQLWRSIPKGIERKVYDGDLIVLTLARSIPKGIESPLLLILLSRLVYIEASQKGLKELSASFGTFSGTFRSIPKGIESQRPHEDRKLLQRHEASQKGLKDSSVNRINNPA